MEKQSEASHVTKNAANLYKPDKAVAQLTRDVAFRLRMGGIPGTPEDLLAREAFWNSPASKLENHGE